MEIEISAHFEDIKSVIIQNINSAQQNIIAAVAWFTDRDIFQALRKQAAKGISVKLALTDDEINRPPKAPSFIPLTSLGCNIYFIKPGSKKESLMHHKFCIIDDNTVITGSYNWTKNAQTNPENITIVRNNTDYTSRFLDAFEQIINQHEEAASSLDSERVKKRLEIIRNQIQLGESEDISIHTSKLKAVSKSAGLQHLLDCLDKGNFEHALEALNAWLLKASALIELEDADLPRLRLMLQALEFELAAINAEIADLERRIYIFNRKHDDVLGDLISLVLELQVKLKRYLAEQTRYENSAEAEKRQKEAKHAEDQYRYFSEEHEVIQSAPQPLVLKKDEEKTLKKLFKQASLLCHPDRVSEKFKKQAMSAFQEIESLYRAQDLNKLQEAFERIRAGHWEQQSPSSMLSTSDITNSRITETKIRIREALEALRALKNSSVAKLIEKLNQEEAWDSYVQQSRSDLNKQIDALNEELARLGD